MTATIIAFPDARDPVGAIRKVERATGLVAKPRGTVVVLERPASVVVPFVPTRSFIPAFLRQNAPSFDPDGPRAA